MPQVRIEFSGNLNGSFDARLLALKVHGQLATIADADLASCKTGLVRLEDVVIADGCGERGMVHVDLRILSGRSREQKQQLGAAVMRDLEQALDKADGMDVQLTVEVRDMDRELYQKVRLTK